mmetsp:Transcript_8903/g.26359  ORF Transcript_8903/g.26359 Transcript_8903/m.26359 type:complete len:425 (-) Transcript_8903:483-1757(-)
MLRHRKMKGAVVAAAAGARRMVLASLGELTLRGLHGATDQDLRRRARRRAHLRHVAVPRGARRDGARRLRLLLGRLLGGLLELSHLLAHALQHRLELGDIAPVGLLLRGERGAEGVLHLAALVALLAEGELQLLQVVDRLLLPASRRRAVRRRRVFGGLPVLLQRGHLRHLRGACGREARGGLGDQVLPHLGDGSDPEGVPPLEGGRRALWHDPLQAELVEHLHGPRGDVVALRLGVLLEDGDHPAVHPLLLVVREHLDRIPDGPARRLRGCLRRLRRRLGRRRLLCGGLRGAGVICASGGGTDAVLHLHLHLHHHLDAASRRGADAVSRREEGRPREGRYAAAAVRGAGPDAGAAGEGDVSDESGDARAGDHAMHPGVAAQRRRALLQRGLGRRGLGRWRGGRVAGEARVEGPPGDGLGLPPH